MQRFGEERSERQPVRQRCRDVRGDDHAGALRLARPLQSNTPRAGGAAQNDLPASLVSGEDVADGRLEMARLAVTVDTHRFPAERDSIGHCRIAILRARRSARSRAPTRRPSCCRAPRGFRSASGPCGGHAPRQWKSPATFLTTDGQDEGTEDRAVASTGMPDLRPWQTNRSSGSEASNWEGVFTRGE